MWPTKGFGNIFFKKCHFKTGSTSKNFHVWDTIEAGFFGSQVYFISVGSYEAQMKRYAFIDLPVSWPLTMGYFSIVNLGREALNVRIKRVNGKNLWEPGLPGLRNHQSTVAFCGGHRPETQLATMNPESQQQVSGFFDLCELRKNPALVSIMSTFLTGWSARILIPYIQTEWKGECYI